MTPVSLLYHSQIRKYWVFTVFVLLKIMALQVNPEYFGTYFYLRLIVKKTPNNPNFVSASESIYEFLSVST